MKEFTSKPYVLWGSYVKVISTLVLLFYFYNLSAQCTAPVAVATPSSQTICSGTAPSILLSADIPGTTFNCSVVETDVTGAVPFNCFAIPVTLYTTGNVTGTAVYTITPSANGCTGNSITIPITVEPRPVITIATSQTICSGDTTSITLSSLPAGATYSWTVTQNGVIGAINGSSDTIFQALSASGDTSGNAIYSVTPVVNGCVGNATDITVTVNKDDASFVYSSATYCQTGTNPTPTITGTTGGVFSSMPTGLSIDSVTGTIDLAISTLGTYTVTYITNSNCPDTSSISITITATPVANFHYLTASFCQNSSNPLPAFDVGASPGTFSSIPTGVIFTNVNTGEVSLSASTSGTYSVINTIPASEGCSASIYSDTITINAADNASFTYNSQNYCITEAPQTPVINGLSGGTFSAIPSGLIINSSSGEINFTSSAVGTYNISYTTNGGCPEISTTVLNIDYTCSNISGYVYRDNDGNCTMGLNDQRVNNIPIRLYDNNNAFIATCYSSSNGFYQFPLSLGTYTVKADTAAITFNCSHPGIDSTVQLLSGNPPATNVNFAADNCTGFNVGVNSIAIQGVVFPGLQHTLKITAGSMYDWFGFDCNETGISGQVQVTVTGPVIYDGPGLGALTPTVTGNTYTYNIADYGIINNLSDFILEFTTNTTAQDVDVICISVFVTPTAGDLNVLDNTMQFCRHVNNSFDPNYKEVYPENVIPGYQDWFTYTIHFQNTGTAPAMNIRLADTLDSNLDLETFELLGYSDTVETSLNSNQLTFYFPNIMLPDSTSDPEGSQGFVQYRIKPKPNMQAGTEIKNTAYIYFDYNAPIATNTAISEFMLTTGINETELKSSLLVYPNPGNGKYYVQLPKEIGSTEISLQMYNVFGDLLINTKTKNQLTQIDLSQKPNGIYILKLIDATGAQFIQRIIQQ